MSGNTGGPGVSVATRPDRLATFSRASFHKLIYYDARGVIALGAGVPTSPPINNYSARLDEPVRYALSVTIPSACYRDTRELFVQREIFTSRPEVAIFGGFKGNK